MLCRRVVWKLDIGLNLESTKSRELLQDIGFIPAPTHGESRDRRTAAAATYCTYMGTSVAIAIANVALLGLD